VTRREQAVIWLLHRIPTAILVAPERVAIKAACALIGLTAIVAVRPSSLNALLPAWSVYVWGTTWLLGGLAGLTGYWRSSREIERAGHWLIIGGAIVYAVAVAYVLGPSGYATVVLVAFIALCSLVRLLVAAGARLSRKRRQ